MLFLCLRGKEAAVIEVIVAEMGKGNFSFLILIVGIAQLIVMLRKKQ